MAFLIVPSLSVSYFMYMQKYQMAILVPAYGEEPSEYPNKKVWFDASEWLSTSQYIKVSDFFIINKKYTPIDSIDKIDVLNALKIIRPLLFALDDLGSSFPELHELRNIGRINTLDLMKDKINYEYIYSEFNEESLKPTHDFFLIKFTHKGKRYELLIRRRTSDGGYMYDHFYSIYRENEWHKNNKNIMTYRDYLAGKIDLYK